MGGVSSRGGPRQPTAAHLQPVRVGYGMSSDNVLNWMKSKAQCHEHHVRVIITPKLVLTIPELEVMSNSGNTKPITLLVAGLHCTASGVD